MRVVIHSFNYSGNDSGIGLITRNSAKRMANKHEIHIISQRKNVLTNELPLKRETLHGCTIHRIKRSSIPIIGALKYFWDVLRITKKLKPDLFHEQELFGIGFFCKKIIRNTLYRFWPWD